MSDTARHKPWRRTCPACGQDVMVEWTGRILPHLRHRTRIECAGSNRLYPLPLVSTRYPPGQSAWPRRRGGK